MPDEPNPPSDRQKAWAEVVGEIAAVLLGAVVVALGFEDFGYGLMVLGALGLVITFVRKRRTLLGPAERT